MNIDDYVEKMRAEWDARATQNAKHFIANGCLQWSEDDFYASGDATVRQDILTDMVNICQGKDPAKMSVLELGCGAGRVTRALAKVFGEVHAADVSAEMLRHARAGLRDCQNAYLYQCDGMTLACVGQKQFDFAYSCCVFCHISSYEVIKNYVRDVGRVLVPGALFKFDVQGWTN